MDGTRSPPYPNPIHPPNPPTHNQQTQPITLTSNPNTPPPKPRQVDFLQWKSDANIREVKVLRRYHIQDREDYVKCVRSVICMGVCMDWWVVD